MEDPLSTGPREWALDPPRRPSLGRWSLCLGPQGCANTAQLYFGKGSKLTVLGKEDSWGSRMLLGQGGERAVLRGREAPGDAGFWVLSELYGVPAVAGEETWLSWGSS